MAERTGGRRERLYTSLQGALLKVQMLAGKGHGVWRRLLSWYGCKLMGTQKGVRGDIHGDFKDASKVLNLPLEGWTQEFLT